MAIWIRSHKACRIAKCSKRTLRKYKSEGKIETKKDPDEPHRLLYKRFDIKKMDLKGTAKSVSEIRKKNQKTLKIKVI